jgi:hypothetical protein
MSFSIPTLRAYRIVVLGIAPADPVILLSVGCNSVGGGLIGTVGTSTSGAYIVYTKDGSNPVYSPLNGTVVPCSTGNFVGFASQIINSCYVNEGAPVSPSNVTIKAIAYSGGLSSNVITGGPYSYTCPGTVTAPTVTSSCPNGYAPGGACSGHLVQYNITQNTCGTTYINYGDTGTITEPTSTSYIVSTSSGIIVTINGAGTNPFGNSTYCSAKTYISACGSNSAAANVIYGYIP